MNIDTKIGPFIKSDDSVSKMMKRLFISLIPIILFTFYKNGYIPYKNGYTNFLGMFYPILFILLGGMSSLLTEEVFLIVFKKHRGKKLIESIKENYGFLPGLFLALVLPINTPLAIVFLGGIFASLIGKMIYGGFGHNIFNPALIGTLFVITCYGALIGSNGGYLNAYELDTISSATPLSNAKVVAINYDSVVAPYGNLLDFFLGNIPGGLGEVSSVLIIIGFLYLTFTKTIKWRITISYVLTFTLMLFLLNSVTNFGYWYILFELLSGGLLFGATYMATDPVTSPITSKGQILYGMCLGIMTFLIRYLTSYPEGVMLSILFMNIFVMFIDMIGFRIEFNKLYYVIFIIPIILIVGLGLYVGYKNIPKEIDEDFNLINKSEENGIVIFDVSQKGFGGDIKAKITFDSKKITGITINSHTESSDRYSMIMDAKYIDKIIGNQKDLDSIDTIAGATITSKAIKDMVSNTIKLYKDEITIEKKDEVEIISKDQNKDALVYVLDVPSFNGKLRLQVVMKNGMIRTALPLSYNDTCISEKNKSDYYECPTYLEKDYINELIVKQNNLGDVDTVSGATISSNALIKAFKYMKGENING